jgi:transcriptional regulator with XRE-family HTH domain
MESPSDTVDRSGRIAFGDKVRELRHERGLSQEMLGQRVDIHRTYISDVEGGKRNPGLDNILKLAGALGVSTSELFEHF